METTDIVIDHRQVPAGYVYCFNDACAKHAECLRWIAGKLTKQNRNNIDQFLDQNLVIRWPSIGHGMTKYWSRHDQALVTAWPGLGLCVTMLFSLCDHAFVSVWPCYGCCYINSDNSCSNINVMIIYREESYKIRTRILRIKRIKRFVSIRIIRVQI